MSARDIGFAALAGEREAREALARRAATRRDDVGATATVDDADDASGMASLVETTRRAAGGTVEGITGDGRVRTTGRRETEVTARLMRYEDKPLADPRAGTSQLTPKVRREFHDDYWTTSHLKLLYLVSRYSNCAQTVYEKERWVRKLPLMVLIYEGIVQKVFEYDYAPESTMVKNTRVYLNVSQEGVDDLDDLIEGELIRGLRLSSIEHQSVLAFQITAAGLALVSKRITEPSGRLMSLDVRTTTARRTSPFFTRPRGWASLTETTMTSPTWA